MKKKLQLIGIVTTANLLLFMLFLVFTHPIYDTVEDVQILYMLSGGFGNAPTSLLHYNHIAHPCLAILLKNLFALNDGINWYTIALLTFHFAACTLIFFQILLKNSTLPFILFYLLLIIVFEFRLLLTVNFTNTSIITGLSGMVLLFTSEKQGRLSVRRVITGCLVLLLGSFWRIHVLIPVIGLALPFFLLFSHKNAMVIAGALILTGGLIMGFNYLQQAYYKSNIAGWQQEENYRQKMYQFYNNHHLYHPNPGEKWYTEYNLIQNGLVVDTVFLSRARLTDMFNELKGKNNSAIKKNTDEKNWFLINNRIFFFTLLLLLVSCKPGRKSIIAALVSGVLITTALTLLSLYFKPSDYLLFTCLFSYAVFFLLSSATFRWPGKTYGYYVSSFFAICLCLWGVIRIYKVNQKQVEQINHFKAAYSEIASKPHTLFIGMGGLFPLQKFYILDVPKHFPLRNYVNDEQFLQNIYKPVFNRFGISGVSALPDHPAVLFWGTPVPALENYFHVTMGRKIHFSQPVQEFKSGNVYKIR